MNQREKIMALVLVVLLAAFGARALYGRYKRSIDRSESELQTARQQLANAKLSLANGRRAIRQIEGWQEISLPPNRDVAQSLYRSWLSQKAKDAGLRLDINPNERASAGTTAYQVIGYSIETKGTLEAVTKFLYEFYRSAKLHQITKLTLVASPGAPELSVSLQVEALILPGATHEETLPDGKSNRLKLASAEEYNKAIGGRNIFKSYTPPRPPRAIARTTPRPPAPEFDEVAQTYVTGILGPPANLQAWITVRTTGEVLRVHAGDDVKVGELKGKIESISPLSVVIKMDDNKQLRVKLGQNLRDAEKQMQEAEKKDAAAAQSAATSDS